MFTILAVTYLVASMQAPALTDRHGRRVLAAGALLLAAGHLALLLAVGETGIGGSIWGTGARPDARRGRHGPRHHAAVPMTVMATMAPEHAGATSGVLSTMQYVGSAIGVAVIGVLFYGDLSHGFAAAFQVSVGALAVTLTAVAVLARLLPATVRS